MRRLTLLFLLIALAAPTSVYGATLSAIPSTFASVYASAQGGDTVQLAAGVYPAFKGASKPSRVTVKAADGASVTMAGAQFVGTSNITIQGVKFTSGVVLRDNAHDIVLDGDVFDGLGPATWEGRLSINLGAHDNTIKNSHFGNGGCSDGVFIGDAPANTIGPGNEFSGIKQGSCSTHSDALQLYDGPKTTITGNYFHDNSTGIMAPNGTSDTVLTNNVFVMDSYPYAAYFGWAKNTTVLHNTIVGGSLHFEDWTDPNNNDHPSAHTTGIVRDNVLAGGIDKVKLTTGALAQDYNLLPAGTTGTHDLTGRPTFTGGAAPSSYAGFTLAPSSLGRANASDGLDRGIQAKATPLPVDSDRDGIPDSADACPNQAGAQADGCPVPPPPPDDPCAQTKAERDQARTDLAAMTADRDQWKAKDEADAQALEDMTVSRDSVQKIADAYKARALKAEDQVQRIRSIAGE